MREENYEKDKSKFIKAFKKATSDKKIKLLEDVFHSLEGSLHELLYPDSFEYVYQIKYGKELDILFKKYVECMLIISDFDDFDKKAWLQNKTTNEREIINSKLVGNDLKTNIHLYFKESINLLQKGITDLEKIIKNKFN